MQKFFELLAKEPGKVAYGLEEVKKALGMGAVSTLILSEDVEDSITEELEIKAEETGAAFEIISIETREGVQLRDIGKIGAILRYAI